MRTRMADVARAAQVSTATVSRALRDDPAISSHTRAAVLAAAEALGYSAPRREGRAVTASIPRVAVLMPYVGRWYFAHVLQSIERILSDHGIETVVRRPFDAKGQRIGFDPDWLASGIRGIIAVSAPTPDDDIRAAEAAGVPVVLIGIAHAELATVRIDDVEAGRLATQHLIDLGHRRIAVVGEGPSEDWRGSATHDRRTGFARALHAAGIEWDRRLDVHSDFTVRGAARAAGALWDMPERPTAVLALSDEMAFGVLGSAQAAGISVPDELSVIGIDDHDATAVLGLTTVAQPVETLGELAALQLARHLVSGVEPERRQLLLPVELIVRGSTAPLR